MVKSVNKKISKQKKPVDSKMGSDGIAEKGNTEMTFSAEMNPRSRTCAYFFTFNNYKTHGMVSGHTDICEHIARRFIEMGCKYIFQEEVGKETGTPHLQGYVNLGDKKRRWTEFKLPKQISWRCVRDHLACQRYCCKEDTRAGKIYHNMPLPQPVYTMKMLDEDQLYDWQRRIIETIKTEPDNRSIWWYYEPKGGAGKSTFCKYLHMKYNALCVSGKFEGVCQMIAKRYQSTGQYPTLVVVDIPRSIDTAYVSFQSLEKIKDGYVTSSKYETLEMCFPSPHLIVFSNALPDIDKCSMDRWKIRMINYNSADLFGKNWRHLGLDDREKQRAYEELVEPA